MDKLVTVTEQREIEDVVRLFSTANEGIPELQKQGIIFDVPQPTATGELIQPRTITYSILSTDYSGDVILVEIIRSLQDYMRAEPKSCYSRFYVSSCYVSLDLVKILKVNYDHKTIRKELNKLMHNSSFFFSYTQKAYTTVDGINIPAQNFDFNGLLVTGYKYDRITGLYKVQLNSEALPFLLYIGKGVGSTEFNYDVLNKLGTLYQRVLYRLLLDWAKFDQIKTVEVSELRSRLRMPENMSVSDIKRRVLAPLTVTLSDNGSKFNFAFEFKRSGNDPMARGFDLLEFHFTDSSRTLPASRIVARIKNLQLLLNDICDSDMRSLVVEVSERLVNHAEYKTLIGRFACYGDQLKKGQITRAKYRNTMLKILRESFGVELRNSKHIRYSRRKGDVLLPQKPA